MNIRWTQPADRQRILDFLQDTGFFREDEMEVAREVLDDALASGSQGHYQSLTAEEGGCPVGWLCFGLTPCTIGTFDIYWIGVHKDCQRKGVGAAMIREAERMIIQRGGRMCIIETSSREIYSPTRKFYAKMGYHEEGRIAGFYTPGDDKVIYVKRLG